MKKITVPLLILMFAVHFTACAQQGQDAKAQPAATVSDDKIIDYVRKVFNIPADVKVEIKENPTTISGMRSIRIEVVSQRGTQTQDAWVTADDKLIVGRSFDMSVDPYEENWAKIDLKGIPSTGAENAEVVIVEYSDFQCPYCSRAHQTVEELLKQYDGKVKVLYKHLPLTSIHNWAEDAAVASSCVYNQNNEAFWKVANYLFENQKAITKETVNAKVVEVAQQSNVDVEKLKACMDSKTTLPTVKSHLDEAEKLGFKSTPSFVVNGRPVVGALPLEEFKQVIDEALKAKKKS